MVIEVIDVPAPGEGEAPSPLVEGAAEVWRRWHLHRFGHVDLADAAATVAASLGEQQHRHKALLTAVDDGEVVGVAWLGMPLLDNQHVAEGDITVLPGRDTVAVTGALWEVVVPRLPAEGRRTVQLWTSHGPGEAAGDRVVPVSGPGRIPRDSTAEALLALGFRLEQVERHSQLDVAEALTRLDGLEAEARAHAGGYEVLSWVGFTPEELREDMAEVMGHMATDVPSGELELEPEQWTAGRVADTERVVDRTGRTRVTTVARHRDSGRLVAYTIIDHPRDKPAVGYQEDTLVVREHRGHRLGMLVKAANLRTLAEHLPHVRRIHTWNAGENAPMLAINHALGFRDVSLEGGWQVTGLDRRPAGDPSRAAADGSTLEV